MLMQDCIFSLGIRAFETVKAGLPRKTDCIFSLGIRAFELVKAGLPSKTGGTKQGGHSDRVLFVNARVSQID